MLKKRIVPQNDNIFNEIQAIRLKAGVSLKTLSGKTKIPIKHLKNLEEGSINLLPDILYSKNIIKKYLTFFNIDAKPYINNINFNQNEKYSPYKPLDSKKLFVLPRIVQAILIIIGIIIILIYMGFAIKKIFDPPLLKIYYPEDGQVMNTSIINVTGYGEKGTKIAINNQEVLMDKDGNFNIEISLQKGVNLIKISGIKRYSKINTIWRNVILELN